MLPDHNALIDQLKACDLSTDNLDVLVGIAQDQRAKKISDCKAEIEAILGRYSLELSDVFSAGPKAKAKSKPKAEPEAEA